MQLKGVVAATQVVVVVGYDCVDWGEGSGGDVKVGGLG